MRKNAVKTLPLLIRYVPNWYKNQEICDKVILEKGEALMFVSGCYKNQKMYNKTVDNYAYALEFVAIATRPKNMQ